MGNHEALIRGLYKEISLVSTDNDRKTLGVINNIISIYQGHFEDLESARRHASEGVNKMPWQSMKYAYSKDIMLKALNLIG
ncbi:hypothetical protein Dfri01_47170 [Dyadobacter frigoris]|nr:hypothetical protein Dfri01_47170 [Dyadobacter frigoris]